jgi:hypothetical protein
MKFIILLVFWCFVVCYVFMLDYIVVVFDHVLHQTYNFAFLVKCRFFVFALFYFSEHSFILKASYFILNLFDFIGFLYFFTKFS